MADITRGIGSNVTELYKDMGGYQAKAVYIAGGSTGASSSLPAGTDRSGTIAAGGTAQQLAPANSSRTSLTGQNISTADLWINEIGGTAAANAPGSYKIISGQAFSVGTNRAISIIGATTGQQFTATEA